VSQFPKVISEHLFIQVPERGKRFEWIEEPGDIPRGGGPVHVRGRGVRFTLGSGLEAYGSPPKMELEDAIAKALQILGEERRYPTVRYSPIPSQSPTSSSSPADELLQFKITAELMANRRENPRPIVQGEHQYQFHSQNYNLLVTLLGRVEEADRSAFLRAVADRIKVFPASGRNKAASFPSWSSQTSELPLVAEFLIRNGGKGLFLETLQACNPSPGIAIMLLQLGEIIALNFPIFSEPEYDGLSQAVGHLRSEAYNVRMKINNYGYALGNEIWEQYGFNGAAACHYICERCDEVKELCRKAGFLYLENSLTENVNLEVNQDKYIVEGFLETFGFSGPLLTALNEAERLNSPGATASELKSSMGHLRSFLEHLHSEAIPRIQKSKSIASPADTKWGTQLTYLRVNSFLSEQEEKFVAGLYALISDEAVHPLIAKREYARLARNVVIEYALLFLRKLEQLALAAP
jgi:hypothetical protein